MKQRVNETREYIKQRFIDSLSEPRRFWERDWTLLKRSRNTSDSEYHGVNQLYLNLVVRDKHYSDNRWFTFNRVKNLNENNDENIHIRKGEKASKVEAWYNTLCRKRDESIDKYREKLAMANNIIGNENSENHNFTNERIDKIISSTSLIDRTDFHSFYRNYAVFNGDRIENIPPRPKVHEIDLDKVKLADTVMNNYLGNENITVSYDSAGQAYYSPMDDSITLPDRDTFRDEEGYISTLVHESCHSTMKESRLNRAVSYDNDSYAREELKAELASTFLCSDLGIRMDEKHIDNHIAYVQSWYDAICDKKDGDRYFFDALRDAQKITDYIKERGNYSNVKREMEMNSVRNCLKNINTDKNIRLLFEYQHKKENCYLEMQTNSDDIIDFSILDHNGEIVDGGTLESNNFSDALSKIEKEYALNKLKLCMEDVEKGEIVYSFDNIDQYLPEIKEKNIDNLDNKNSTSNSKTKYSETLLNSQSSIDCNYNQEIKHCKENNQIIEILDRQGSQYLIDVSISNSNKNEQKLGIMTFDEAMKKTEYFDLKNGADFLTTNEGDVIIRCHGTFWEENNKVKHSVNELKLKFIDKNGSSINANDFFNKTNSHTKKNIKTLSSTFRL